MNQAARIAIYDDDGNLLGEARRVDQGPAWEVSVDDGAFEHAPSLHIAGSRLARYVHDLSMLDAIDSDRTRSADV